MKKYFKSEKGTILVFLAVGMVALLALTGLALDLGMAFGVKTRLNAAVDAAALAAGRAISQGTAAAGAQAEDYFNANYRDGVLGTAGARATTSAIHNADGSWTVTVTAPASVPTNFARIVGINSLPVSASATTTVKTLDMMLVLDCSGSMQGSFTALQEAAVHFIDKFQEGPGGDRIGLVSFASGAVLNVPIDKTSTRGFRKTSGDGTVGVISAINGLNAGGATASEEAMRLARAELDAIPSSLRSSLRVIVFFSDGAPNTISGTFLNYKTYVTGDLYSETTYGDAPSNMFVINRLNSQMADAGNIRRLPGTDYTGTVNLESYNNRRTFSYTYGSIENTRCNVNKAARNMVENIANAARSGNGNNAVTIFTLGLGTQLQRLEINFCGYDSSEYGEKILKRIANDKTADTFNADQPAGMYVFAANTNDLDNAFNKIASALLHISK